VMVRQGVLQPPAESTDVGGMVTVVHGGGLGYAATPDLSPSGISAAIERAAAWAERTAARSVIDFGTVPTPNPVGSYASPVVSGWDSMPLADKIQLLAGLDARLAHDKVVDRSATLWRHQAQTLYLTNGGGRVEQRLEYFLPDLQVVASDGPETQIRTFGSRGVCRQGGLEVLDDVDFRAAPERLVEEALALLTAPDCPTGAMDLLLAPDQMLLQIHESIGHPIELDRILGDERNYAGTSFVTADMFGSYQYGSELLNVSFDPGRDGEFASYAFDDDGAPAQRHLLIERGILKRPLGGLTSQARAGMAGVANSRATSWNRPPIDRMANLNVEPGDSSLDDLIGRVERGVYLQTNCSWSIDDSRNKFQFGCEYGRVIEDGQLGHVVKKPNYRGISATFWRNLVGVGDASTEDVLGSPYCGKGEPNQVIRVGHASPACLFSGVEVFGGA
jgi:predicted Zn-dependent protease